MVRMCCGSSFSTLQDCCLPGVFPLLPSSRKTCPNKSALLTVGLWEGKDLCSTCQGIAETDELLIKVQIYG